MTRKKSKKITKEDVFDLYKELSGLSDARRLQGKRHSIELVVILVILAIMSGYDGYHAIGDFIKRNNKELVSIFNPKKNRLPSYSTIRRVMNQIDFEELCHIFEKWAKKYIEIGEKEWISIDGKSIKGTIPDKENEFVNMVSLFCLKKKQVFSMGKVDDKSNEIPKVQELIEKFPATNVIYRMDALHCQKKTIRKILKKESFYVLQVKNNQKKLLKKVKFIAKHLPVISSSVTKEKNKGRLEIRKVTTHKEHLDLRYYGWDDLKLIIQVQRIVKYKGGKTSEETAYFITNLNEKASFFNKGIRDHWKIENCLHYIKDVVFKEDRLKIRTGMAPQNMSLLRAWVINILRRNGYSSITQATRLLVGNIKAMVALF